MNDQGDVQAFPSITRSEHVDVNGWDCGSSTHKSSEGMKLRDYFAAKAMQGDWASQCGEFGFFRASLTVDDFAIRASLFYRMADAMMVAREEGGK